MYTFLHKYNNKNFFWICLNGFEWTMKSLKSTSDAAERELQPCKHTRQTSPYRQDAETAGVNCVVHLLLTWVSGALTWDSMPGILTLFLCRYFKKTSAFLRANVHACEGEERERVSAMTLFFGKKNSRRSDGLPWERPLSAPDVCWSWEWRGLTRCSGPVYQRHRTSPLLSCTPAPGFLTRCRPDTYPHPT